VSTTVTEKGYAADVGLRQLDLNEASVRADLADSQPHRSVVGQLVGGFARRAELGAGGLTVLCCDNVPRGGDLLRALCQQFVEQWSNGASGQTRAWIDEQARFPNTLVDRIVPATSAETLDACAQTLGYRDEALVTTEPFGLWVIEDDFAAGHPQWPGDSVKLVPDITPWADVKLRLLNGGHSLLAYLGLLEGRRTIGEAIRTPSLAQALSGWLDEASGSLGTLPQGLDLEAYRQSLVARFENPGIIHRLDQIAMDGSLKLPTRVFPVAVDLLGRGRDASFAALALAAWLTYLDRNLRAGIPVVDPVADQLEIALTSSLESRAVVDAVLGASGIVPMPEPLQGSFLDEVVRSQEVIRRTGRAQLREWRTRDGGR
jgi:fructuronate reductase